jgi:hypothetical protein
MSMLGEKLEPVLPHLAALQRQGAVSVEKVQIVERAMQKLSRPDLRLHGGLDEVCGRLLKMTDQPSVGGVPASVIVTIGVEELLAKTGLAETSDGSMLTSDQLLRMADEAEIWPTFINQENVPLALGRSQRLASRGQTTALITRDGGCSFPGGTHPPSWCDRHHILDWILAGLTDLDNLTRFADITTPISFRRAGPAG